MISYKQLIYNIPNLDHEVFTEAPARLCALLSQGAHVVLEAAQVLGEGHEEEGSQLEQQRVPGFLRPRRVLQRIRQHHTPARTRREASFSASLSPCGLDSWCGGAGSLSPVVLLVAEIAADLVHDGGARQDVGFVLLLVVVALDDDDDPVCRAVRP